MQHFKEAETFGQNIKLYNEKKCVVNNEIQLRECRYVRKNVGITYLKQT